ncbi:unnamed protein product [Meganyctiphanes norvegica]|uniref:Uncharacterized protein n=1 Tax=Meganyctiphanes norvegica TaxID=48144 RepID=A0AAV2PR54_MEGNR
MKPVVFSVLIASAFALPQLQTRPFYSIVRYDAAPPLNGAYNFVFETENNIRQAEEGVPGNNAEGSTVVQGTYSYALDDGSVVEVRYIADENGYRAESPILPLSPANPAHVEDLIRKAQEEDAQGIIFDDLGFRIN